MGAPPNGSRPSASATSSRRCGPPPPRTCRGCRPPIAPTSPARAAIGWSRFLRAVHRGDRTVPVADLDAFAAACADDACRDYLRRTRPARARLANRLRLLCTRGTGVAMWRTGPGVLIAGLPAWTHRAPLERPFPWRDQPKAWWGNALAAADGSALVPTVMRILEKAGAPLPMDALADLVGGAHRPASDVRTRLDASPEGDEPELAVLSPAARPTTCTSPAAISIRRGRSAWRCRATCARRCCSACATSSAPGCCRCSMRRRHAAAPGGRGARHEARRAGGDLGPSAVGRSGDRPPARHHRAAGAEPAHGGALALLRGMALKDER